jgi:hypothetical protein
MANSISAITTGIGGVVIDSVDTTGNLNLKSGGTTVVAVTSTGASVTGLLAGSTNYTGFKNRIINGAMVIDQRYAGASVTPVNGQYIVDRFGFYGTPTSKFSMQQNAGSVTSPSGFKNYLGFTSLSAYSIGSTEWFQAYQVIEGYNIADLGYGAAGAQTVTLSFWVRGSIVGTYGGFLCNSDGTRAYNFSYTISVANTWEQKTITVVGDTIGTWLNTNGAGLQVVWSLGAGSSTLTGTSGSWSSTLYRSVTGQVNVSGTNGATFYITGVQLEKGSTATSFDVRDYGRELAMCQRYYTKILSFTVGYNVLAPATAASTNTAGAFISYPVTMRTAPTFSYANIILADGAVSSVVNSIVATWAGTNTANVTFSGATANLTTYRPTPLIANNTASAFIDMSAEL